MEVRETVDRGPGENVGRGKPPQLEGICIGDVGSLNGPGCESEDREHENSREEEKEQKSISLVRKKERKFQRNVKKTHLCRKSING